MRDTAVAATIGGNKWAASYSSSRILSIKLFFISQTISVLEYHQLVSLSQSWTVGYSLNLYNLGPEDWTMFTGLLDTLDSVRGVVIKRWSATPSVSLLETLWNKTGEEWILNCERYCKTNEEDFYKLVMKHFQSRV